MQCFWGEWLDQCRNTKNSNGVIKLKSKIVEINKKIISLIMLLCLYVHSLEEMKQYERNWFLVYYDDRSKSDIITFFHFEEWSSPKLIAIVCLFLQMSWNVHCLLCGRAIVEIRPRLDKRENGSQIRVTTKRRVFVTNTCLEINKSMNQFVKKELNKSSFLLFF